MLLDLWALFPDAKPAPVTTAVTEGGFAPPRRARHRGYLDPQIAFVLYATGRITFEDLAVLLATN